MKQFYNDLAWFRFRQQHDKEILPGKETLNTAARVALIMYITRYQ